MVRIFPRTPRVRVLASLLAAGLATGVAVAPAAFADDLRDKEHAVQRQITGAHEAVEESSARARTAASALDTAQGRLESAQAHLAQTRGELAAAEVFDQQMQANLEVATQRLEQARADLSAGRTNVAEQQRTLGQIVVQNYQTGDPSLMGLSMVLTSQDPTELTGQLNSVQNVIDKESVVLDQLEASRALLTVQAREVRYAKVDVARQREAAATNLRNKVGLEDQAQGAEAQVSSFVVLQAAAQQEAEKARAADLAQLDGLQKERNRIAAILKQRAEEARRRAAAAAAAARAARAAASAPILSDTGPTSSNGFLDYPLQGPVTSPFGWRTHPIYGYRALHDGIDFGAACGTPIRAAASGTVLETYFQSAWGNRVIIDHGFHHGSGLATITNHMSGPAIVSTGEHVQRGQIVGYVGTTGWSTGCHLHYTVLQDGSPVDPMSWF